MKQVHFEISKEYIDANKVLLWVVDLLAFWRTKAYYNNKFDRKWEETDGSYGLHGLPMRRFFRDKRTREITGVAMIPAPRFDMVEGYGCGQYVYCDGLFNDSEFDYTIKLNIENNQVKSLCDMSNPYWHFSDREYYVNPEGDYGENNDKYDNNWFAKDMQGLGVIIGLLAIAILNQSKFGQKLEKYLSTTHYKQISAVNTDRPYLVKTKVTDSMYKSIEEYLYGFSYYTGYFTQSDDNKYEAVREGKYYREKWEKYGCYYD